MTKVLSIAIEKNNGIDYPLGSALLLVEEVLVIVGEFLDSELGCHHQVVSGSVLVFPQWVSVFLDILAINPRGETAFLSMTMNLLSSLRKILVVKIRVTILIRQMRVLEHQKLPANVT